MPTDARLAAFLADGPEIFSSVQQGQTLWKRDPFDVESLNAPARTAFDRLVNRATRKPLPDSGKLLLLLGESGSGKTHLVRAFRNSVHGRKAGYVGYMPMTVDAVHYDRHILSYLIDSLDQPYDSGDGEDSGLMRLSNAVMGRCMSAFAPLIPEEQILDDPELHDMIRSVADELHADEAFRHVDVQLLRALICLQRREARFHHRILQWLRCEDLAPADRAVIGDLVPRTADNDPIRMLTHLGLLMGVMGQALVLCVDQVEDISDFEQNTGMEPSFRRAMNNLAALAGKVPTAIVVVCCLENFWMKMRHELNQAMRDRILGRAVMKVSAVKVEHRVVEAPALTFDSQEEFMHAYKAGRLDRDFVAVLRFQGPRANGMPELHALTPALANLQDAGRKVALVTDGRMSGASGKVPAAIHVSPEILAGGPLGLVRDGDIIRLDAGTGTLEALVPAEVWAARSQATTDLGSCQVGMGRELFAMFRSTTSPAEQGAATFPLPSPIPSTLNVHEGADIGNTVPGSDEDFLIKNPK